MLENNALLGRQYAERAIEKWACGGYRSQAEAISTLVYWANEEMAKTQGETAFEQEFRLYLRGVLDYCQEVTLKASTLEQELDAALALLRTPDNTRKQREAAKLQLGRCIINMREQLEPVECEYLLQFRHVTDRLRDDCAWSVYKAMLAHLESEATNE